jgi:hypothetical protein
MPHPPLPPNPPTGRPNAPARTIRRQGGAWPERREDS